jgi:HEAT repeat protein
MADIWKSIRQSKLVIADLTGRNPNVFYELGLAHAIQKPVILLSQNVNDVPFDLRHVRVIIYMNTEQGRRELQTKLQNTLQALMGEIEKTPSAERYAVLEPERQTGVPVGKNVERLLRLLDSGEPAEIMRALSRIVETYQDRKRPKNCDPKILNAILPHLRSPFPELQLMAVRALGAAGEALHAQYLHTFLSSDNPILIQTTIMALDQIGDRWAVSELTKMLNNPTYQAFRVQILTTIASSDPPAALPLLTKIIKDNHADVSEREVAMKTLANMATDKAIDVLLSLDVDAMGSSLRSGLAKALAEIESPYDPPTLRKLETLLSRLGSDESHEVRAHALVAWCLHSLEPSGVRLDRSFLWNQLDRENGDVLFEFLNELADYRAPFAPKESSKLVNLVEKYPDLIDSVIFLLRDNGDESVADFMIKAYNESSENRLWVLAYLSRVPSRKAVKLLREEVREERDASRVSLAAIALSRLGAKDTTDLLLKRVSGSYPWIQARAIPYLHELLPYATSKKRQEELKRAIKKLTRTSRGFY